jgi:hypothetical protein
MDSNLSFLNAWKHKQKLLAPQKFYLVKKFLDPEHHIEDIVVEGVYTTREKAKRKKAEIKQNYDECEDDEPCKIRIVEEIDVSSATWTKIPGDIVYVLYITSGGSLFAAKRPYEVFSDKTTAYKFLEQCIAKEKLDKSQDEDGYEIKTFLLK